MFLCVLFRVCVCVTTWRRGLTLTLLWCVRLDRAWLRTQATLAAMDPDERAEREEYDRKNMNKRAGVECSFNNVVSK